MSHTESDYKQFEKIVDVMKSGPPVSETETLPYIADQLNENIFKTVVSVESSEPQEKNCSCKEVCLREVNATCNWIYRALKMKSSSSDNIKPAPVESQEELWNEIIKIVCRHALKLNSDSDAIKEITGKFSITRLTP